MGVAVHCGKSWVVHSMEARPHVLERPEAVYRLPMQLYGHISEAKKVNRCHVPKWHQGFPLALLLSF